MYNNVFVKVVINVIKIIRKVWGFYIHRRFNIIVNTNIKLAKKQKFNILMKGNNFMGYIDENDDIVLEAVQMTSIPEMKVVKKQVILSPGVPVGRGNMCFLYTKDFNQSIKMMTNNDNFITKNHYLLYFYPTTYAGKVNNKTFRYRENDERHKYCEIVDKKVKGITGYDRVVINASEKRNIFIDLHRYINIFENACVNLAPSKYMEYYWNFMKSIFNVYMNDIYKVTYPIKYVLIDLKNFTISKSLKENLRNPLYMIFYTLYRNYRLIKDLNVDFYFYNERKVLYINPSHEDEESYKTLRVEMKKMLQGTMEASINKITDDTEIKKAENIEEPTQNIISKIYDDPISSPQTLLDKSPINYSIPSPKTDEGIKDKVVDASKEVSMKLTNDVKALDKEVKKDTKSLYIKDVGPKESPFKAKVIDDSINDTINNAITKTAEEDINKDTEMIDKIYQDLRKNIPTQTPVSEREKMLRKAQYDIKIGNTTVKDLEKIKAQDILIEEHDVSSQVSGINKNMTDIKFNQFEKTYNEKLMKKDIVDSVLALNDKSLPLLSFSSRAPL